MKKKNFLILLILSIMFIVPQSIFASAPMSTFNFLYTDSGNRITPTNNIFHRGDTIYINKVVYDGNSWRLGKDYLEIMYDSNVFEFNSFSSDYGFTYDSNKKIISGKDIFEHDESGAYTWFLPDNAEKYSTLWKITLKVKDDAPIGKTIVNSYAYEIECLENDDKCISSLENETNKENNIVEDDAPPNIFNNTQFIILVSLFIVIFIEMLVLIIINIKKKK